MTPHGTNGLGQSADGPNVPPLSVEVSLDSSARAARALNCTRALSGHVGGELVLVGSAVHDDHYDETASLLDTLLPGEACERFVRHTGCRR